MGKKPPKQNHEIWNAVVEERQRISRELHDRVLQLLSSVRMRAESCRRRLPGNRGALENELHTIEENIDKAITEIRNLLTENQSLEDLQAGSLERRLKQELDIFRARTGFKLDFRCAIDTHKLPAAIERELYFTLREGILNAVRHSRATELHLLLTKTANGCAARLRDNGEGFDAASTEGSNHYGLKGMRERIRKIGGELDLHTAPGKGTEIKIKIPFAN
ncbi:MAG TPA: sensor histidine kinase [Verrucomicrobiae bacterium]|nr:sensor histidine kinase [Verrucomicrobiae bacterium]